MRKRLKRALVRCAGQRHLIRFGNRFFPPKQPYFPSQSRIRSPGEQHQPQQSS